MTAKQKPDDVKPIAPDVEAFLAGVKPDLEKTVEFFLVDRTNAIRQADTAAQIAHDEGDTKTAERHARDAQKHRDEMEASKRTVTLRPMDPDALWALQKRAQAGEDYQLDLIAATAVDPEWTVEQWRELGKAVRGPILTEIYNSAEWVNGSVAVMPDFSPTTSGLLKGLRSEKS